MFVIGAAQSVALVIAVAFLCYVTAIVVAFVRQPRDPLGDPDDFVWHVFVPCLNEAAVIGETLARLIRDFPACHVWVVDDDSEDATASIVADVAAAHERVHLVQRRRPHARSGKGQALNAGYAALCAQIPPGTDRERVIVCVMDADGHLDPGALAAAAGPSAFGDPIVGAAQTQVVMRNRDDVRPRPEAGRLSNAFARYLVRMQDLEFRGTIAAMQFLRERTRSVGLGGNGQFTRLSVLDTIGQEHGAPWHGALLEDFELGVHVALTGYRNRYLHGTWVSQEALVSLRALLRQRTRWAQGNMQCAVYFKRIAGSRHFTNAGAIEVAYYLILPFVQVLGWLIWPVVTVSAVSHMTAGAHGVTGMVTVSWWFLALESLLAVAPFALWGPLYRSRYEPGTSRFRALGWGLGYWLYVYYMYVCNARALIRLVQGRSGWDKTRRNAELTGSAVLESQQRTSVVVAGHEAEHEYA